MSSKPKLHIAPCSYEAAKFAVERWHYSASMPNGKRVAFGVWEGGDFTGAIVFGSGANRNIGSPYNLALDEICELTRIALRRHVWPVTRMGAIALKLLSKENPGLRMVVSYADPARGHHGGIYQGMNWLFVGRTTGTEMIKTPSGAVLHKKTFNSRYGHNSAKMDGYERVQGPEKLKYLYPLDDAMRRRVKPLSKPYPKPEDLPAPEAS